MLGRARPAHRMAKAKGDSLPRNSPAEAASRVSEVVRLESVVRIYGEGDNQVRALDNVTVGFRQATFTAVMGPSGSGKSTLLQCAAGLDKIDGGAIWLAGTSLQGLSATHLAKLRRTSVGFVFQSFNLVPALTARHNVTLPLQLAGQRPDDDEVHRTLTAVGLADRADHLPSELSGGQQQRVAIARALITKPDVLFADEPTGALDSESSREVLTLLRDTVDAHGQTLVVVTHDPAVAAASDRVLFLADGRLVDELTEPTFDRVTSSMALLQAAL